MPDNNREPGLLNELEEDQQRRQEQQQQEQEQQQQVQHKLRANMEVLNPLLEKMKTYALEVQARGYQVRVIEGEDSDENSHSWDFTIVLDEQSYRWKGSAKEHLTKAFEDK